MRVYSGEHLYDYWLIGPGKVDTMTVPPVALRVHFRGATRRDDSSKAIEIATGAERELTYPLPSASKRR